MRKSLFTSVPRLSRPVMALIIVVVIVSMTVLPVLALFTNGDFETGDFSNWSVSTFLNNTSLTCYTGESCITQSSGGTDTSAVVGGPAVDPMTQTDPVTGVIKYPRFGHYAARVGNTTTGYNANKLIQTDTITNSDIDPRDGLAHIRFAYAPVLQNPSGHSSAQQPFFFIGVKNTTKSIWLYEKFAFSGQAGVPWISATYNSEDLYYTDWQIVDIALTSGTQWSSGDSIELEVIAAGCTQSGHFGYVYVDAFGAFLPGLDIVASGPATISKNQDITYAYSWGNTGETSLDNVTITAVAPANTTYVSDDASCSNSSGTVTCNLGTKAAGTNGTIHITFHVNGSASGTLYHGNYHISATGFAALLGPLVSTTVNPDNPPTDFQAYSTSISGSYEHDLGTFSYTATGGIPDPSYSLAPGSTLPSGVTFNTVTQTLSGTPTETGDFTFKIRASNIAGYLDTNTITLHVAKVNPSVSISATSASVYGQPVTFTATVSPIPSAYTTPTGTVQFYWDGNALGSPVTLSSGTATSPVIKNLAVGSHSITAYYSGNSNYNAIWDSSSRSQIVNIASTISAIASNHQTSIYGQRVHFTVTVTPINVTHLTPFGTVQFYIDGSTFGSAANLDVNGQAQSNDIINLLPGNHTVRVDYAANGSYYASSTLLTQTVNRAPTTVTVSSPASTITYGESSEYRVTVTQDPNSEITPDGSVQFKMDGVTYNSAQTLDITGKAKIPVPSTNLWPGDHKITAFYAGNSNFVASDNAASPYHQIVLKAHPVISLTPTPTSPVFGQPVSFAVNVAHYLPTQGTPSGTVTLMIDGTPSGFPVALDLSGNATFSSISAFGPSAASHSISVAYSGDDYYLTDPATPYSINLTVAKANTTATVLDFSPKSVVVGQPVTVHASVSPVAPGAGSPSGTVTVSAGPYSCTAPLSAGDWSCSFTPTAPGSLSISASFDGDPKFNPSSPSAAVSGLSVDKAASVAAITGFSSSPSPAVTGQPVTFNFSLLPVAPGNGTPSGTVTISDGAGHSCSAILPATSCSISFPSAGPKSLTISYPGDPNFYGTTADPFTSLSIIKASTSASLVSSHLASVYGEPIHFSTSLSVSGAGSGTPSGQVQFAIDGSPFGAPVTLVSGSAASGDVSSLALGNHTISVQYLGDPNFNSSSAVPITQNVAQAFTTTLKIVSMQNPSPYGIPVTVWAIVEANSPSIAIPSGGSVQFYVDGEPFVDPVALNSEGKASKLLPWTALWVGTHDVTAVYSGSTNFHGSNSTSNPLKQQVDLADTTPTLTLSAPNPEFGQPFHLNAILRHSLGGADIPSGTLTFKIDGVTLANLAALDANGSASTPDISSLAVGPHTVTLVYSGDDRYAPKTMTLTDAIVVQKAATSSTSPTFSKPNPVVGELVAVSVLVAPTGPGAGTPTGEVIISNGTDHCHAPLLSNGSATCNLIPTQSGSPQLTATYSGDGSFLGYGPTTPVNGPSVGPASASFLITSVDPGPVVAGQPVSITVTATPTPPSTLPPTGTIRLFFGTDFCDATFVNGVATCQVIPTSLDPQNVSASYSGNANFNAGSSNSVGGPTVNKAATSAVVVSSKSSTVYGEPVHFTATLTQQLASTLTPTGSVQFKIDGADLGSPVSLTNGVAVSADFDNFPANLYSISAVYIPGTLFQSTTSTGITQDVGKVSTTSVVVPSKATSVYGQVVKFTATVTQAANSNQKPSGEVQFKVDGIDLGAPVTVTNGTAVSPDYTSLSTGHHKITVAYAGTANFVASDSPNVSNQTVTNASTSAGLVASKTGTVYGEGITFTAAITQQIESAATPTGKVQFRIDGSVYGGPVDLIGGVAVSPVYILLAGGNHKVSVDYLGTDGFDPSGYSNLNVDILKANSSISVDGSSPSVTTGQGTQFTATLSAVSPGAGSPTGKVQFKVNGIAYGNPVNIIAGTATTPETFLGGVGTYTITADYLGDGNFNPSTSTGGFTQTITGYKTFLPIMGK